MTSPASALADAAQRLVLSLYEGGVLSPAVLERVIASVGRAPLDWQAISTVRATDRRSIREIVVAVMMPGNPLDNVERDFVSIIEHVTGLADAAAQRDGRTGQAASTKKKRPANAAASPEASEAEDDDALLAQLAGANRSRRKRASSSASAGRKLGFDLSNNAVPPKRSKGR
ncbi:hypothetical protein PQR02_02280 [Paraburkholderia sediminicola]|uniref:Uncharacterized protein n=1 Tax=Paraburkholderia rhynchosiae TaxID=487049 RepID=A0ACC7N427_9BURK